MGILSDMKQRLAALESCAGADAEGRALLDAIRRLSTDAVVDVVSIASAMKHDADRLISVGAAVVAERSTRELGQSGAAAVRGHTTPVSLVQSISGGSRADAVRAVRVGEALLEGADASDGSSDVPADPCWHDCLDRALLGGSLTSAQHDAIRRGLGEPPTELGQVWALAATQLAGESESIDVDELARRARQVRDALDPAGLEERQARRFAARSLRTWTDADGGHHARIDFADEDAAFWNSVIASALRPRRGGPRFMTDAERAAADELVADPRTNEQLTYDLVTDVFRAGALASASDVFGVRQPGVRMIVVKDAIGPRDAVGRLLATGHLDDGGDALAGSVIDRALCEVGAVEVTVDSCGNPLDVGREQRLFTPRQKLALAVRDGGCMWPGCCAPASYCEAHHCEQWAEGGKTDIDAGVLLCRFHHMLLHNAGWRILRVGKGPILLQRPPGSAGEPIPLRSKSAVRWAWDPPPPAGRSGWRAA